MERVVSIAREVARTVLPIAVLFAYSVGVTQCSTSEQARGTRPFAERRGDLELPASKASCARSYDADGSPAPAA